jgi:hypothetical protein
VKNAVKRINIPRYAPTELWYLAFDENQKQLRQYPAIG